MYIASARNGNRRSVLPLTPSHFCAILQTRLPGARGWSHNLTLISAYEGMVDSPISSHELSEPGLPDPVTASEEGWAGLDESDDTCEYVNGSAEINWVRTNSLRHERRISYATVAEGLGMYCLTSIRSRNAGSFKKSAFSFAHNNGCTYNSRDEVAGAQNDHIWLIA